MKNTDFGIDSRYRSKKEELSEAASLMEFRLEKMKKLPKEKIIEAKLMQLQFKMEEFLKNQNTLHSEKFTDFLKSYVDALYSNRANFAKDISISAVQLSQIINNHREPNDDFLKKLMIHSEKTFENIKAFNKKIWYEVFLHEKMCEIMNNQKQWKSRLAPEVRFSESKI